MNFKKIVDQIKLLEPKTALELYAKNEMLNKFPSTSDCLTERFVESIVRDHHYDSENEWKFYLKTITEDDSAERIKYWRLYEFAYHIEQTINR